VEFDTNDGLNDIFEEDLGFGMTSSEFSK